MNIPAPKIGVSQIGPKMVIFSILAPTVVIKCQKFMDTISLNKTGIFRKIMVCILRVQK
jgi:hypothetical protein